MDLFTVILTSVVCAIFGIYIAIKFANVVEEKNLGLLQGYILTVMTTVLILFAAFGLIGLVRPNILMR